MNTVEEILTYASENHLKLTINGKKLVIEGDLIPGDFIQAAKARKPELIQALQTRWNPELVTEGYVWCLDCKHWNGGTIDNDAEIVCTHKDNPFHKQQPLAPRKCRWYEVKI